MTEKTIKAFGVGTMWVETDGPVDEDSFLPIARIMGAVFILAFLGIILLSFIV